MGKLPMMNRARGSLTPLPHTTTPNSPPPRLKSPPGTNSNSTFSKKSSLDPNSLDLTSKGNQQYETSSSLIESTELDHMEEVVQGFDEETASVQVWNHALTHMPTELNDNSFQIDSRQSQLQKLQSDFQKSQKQVLAQRALQNTKSKVAATLHRDTLTMVKTFLLKHPETIPDLKSAGIDFGGPSRDALTRAETALEEMKTKNLEMIRIHSDNSRVTAEKHKKSIDTLEKRVQDLAKQLQAANEALAGKNDDLASYQIQMESLNDTVKVRNRQITSSEKLREDLQDELTRAKATTTRSILQLQAEHNRTQSQVDTLRLENEQLLNYIDAEQQRVLNRNSSLKRLRSDLNDQADTHSRKLKRVRTDLEQSNQERDTLQSRYDQLERDDNQLQESLQQSRSDCELKVTEIADLESRLQARNGEIDTLKTKITEHESRESQDNERITLLTGNITALTSDRNLKIGQIRELRHSLRLADERAQHLELSVNAFKEKNENAAEDLQISDFEVSRLQGELTDHKLQRATLSAANFQLRKEVADIQTEHSRLQKRLGTAATRLNICREERTKESELAQGTILQLKSNNALIQKSLDAAKLDNSRLKTDHAMKQHIWTERVSKLKSDATLEQQKLGHTISQLGSEIATKQQDLDAANAEKAQLKSTTAATQKDLQTTISRLEADNAATEQNLSTAKLKNNQLDAEVIRLTSDKTNLASEKAIIETNLDQAQSETSQLKSSNAIVQKDLEDARIKISQQDQEIRTKSDTLSSQSTELTQHRTTLLDRETLLQAYRNWLSFASVEKSFQDSINIDASEAALRKLNSLPSLNALETRRCAIPELHGLTGLNEPILARIHAVSMLCKAYSSFRRLQLADLFGLNESLLTADDDAKTFTLAILYVIIQDMVKSTLSYGTSLFILYGMEILCSWSADQTIEALDLVAMHTDLQAHVDRSDLVIDTLYEILALRFTGKEATLATTLLEKATTILDGDGYQFMNHRDNIIICTPDQKLIYAYEDHCETRLLDLTLNADLTLSADALGFYLFIHNAPLIGDFRSRTWRPDETKQILLHLLRKAKVRSMQADCTFTPSGYFPALFVD